MTEIEKRIWEYIRSAYPQGIRSDAWEELSITESYDKVRASIFAVLEQIITQWVKQLSIQTCTEEWLILWENFLYIPTNPSLSVGERRATILSKLIGSNSTISDIRILIESYLSAGTSAYKITERWKISSDLDEVWTYVVSIYHIPSYFDPVVIERLLKNVHPAHCNLIIEYTPPILDNIGMTESIDSYIHAPTVWLDQDNLPASIPNNELWGDMNNPKSWFVWQ